VCCSVVELHLYCICPLNDMVVGDDVTIFIDDEAASHRPDGHLSLLRHIEKIPEKRDLRSALYDRTCDVDMHYCRGE
jgi:hypothetical protein